MMSETVMIVAGETSGELYGALLAGRLRALRPDIGLIGIGGERMREAGVEIIAGIASAFGLLEAFSALRRVRSSFRAAVRALRQRRPSVIVLIDYPDFNLRLAAEAKSLGIPILYYVSPQVWAWRKGRVRTIASLVDRMAVVLPFEEEIYRETGLACEFVGHPVWDEIKSISGERAEIKRRLGFAPDRPVLSILPGSRPSELKRLLPVLAASAALLKQREPALQFSLPFAPNTDPEMYASFTAPLAGLGCRISKGDALETLAASDAAVITSGTATLQAALLGVPLVVVYRMTPFSYWLGKRIISVPHISLVNLIAGEAVVRELLQKEANPSAIAEAAQKILTESSDRTRVLGAFERIRQHFAGRSASERVAEIVMELAGGSKGSGHHAAHL